MAVAMMSWLVAIPLLGFTTGLRSMTPIAVLCWFAYLGSLVLDENWDQWTARLVVAIVLTILAVGELVSDKFPWIPNRTSAGPFIWRLLLGGFCGAVAADALNGSEIEGILLGVVGAVLGTFCGYMVRRELCERAGCRDWQVALAEDVIAIVGAIFALHVITG